jgi:YqjK-like protein
MNKRLLILAQRRDYLVLQAAKQRALLAQTIEVWRAPLALADQGLAVISFIKKHPILIAGSSAVLVRLLRKSFIGKWFGRGLLGWQIARKLQNRFLT